MTDQMMFEAWSELLRPLFPAGAEFTFKPRRKIVCVTLPQAPGMTAAGTALHSVAIDFTQLAWKTYRGARMARRARADAILVAIVKSALAQYDAENAVYETPGGELGIEVASIDLFPPPAGVMAATLGCAQAA